MSLETVKQYFASKGISDRVLELSESSATVELAARALGCQPEHIAKTMSFHVGGNPILVVTAGNVKIDNRKFRDEFNEKARMIPFEEVDQKIGHAPGGVCPFALNEGVGVFLDVSLKKYETVYPAGGNSSSAVKMTIPELEEHSSYTKWVDVCREAV